ncbi:hypothetical protein HFO82_31730 [Rhizobium leguminosarum]|uniref:right-handed parallel beta-helix repeat-containing protein n=1 Tax=Rhizobium leguminosarum TaxID=384 RepID=UPI00103D1CBC|nr:right-handed parallel beta-helix repeat-containing protein [Rhizobium leguminosarum]MBY5503146.1 hypothetical protein [Rhizobium leguminosarum]NKK31563.1 hypothetical protein [Rhizobium leguminosarum bv. viciae]TBZ45487.1 hypothetical protein E0H42_30485 [Rhizobium leguminosarum bv. viciae]
MLPTKIDSVMTTIDVSGLFVTNVKSFGAVGNGIADDTAAINAALASGAKELYFPPGNYRHQALTVPSTLHRMYGSGAGSCTLTGIGSPASYTPFLYFNAIAEFEIFGFKLNYNHTTYALNPALHFGGCSDVHVHHVNVAEGGYIGMYFSNCQRVWVEKNKWGTTAHYQCHADTGSGNVKILDNYFTGAAGGHIIHIGGGNEHLVRGNVIDATVSGSFGISLTDSVFESIVSGNLVRTGYLEGIQLTDSFRNTIEGNQIICTGATHTDMGISLSAEGGDVFDNIVIGNRIHECGTTGIGLASDSRLGTKQCFRNLVADNKIFNPNKRTSGGVGCWIYGTLSTSNTMRDNEVDDQASTVQYAVKEYNNGDGNPNNNLFIHNNLRSGARIADALALGGGTVIKAL